MKIQRISVLLVAFFITLTTTLVEARSPDVYYDPRNSRILSMPAGCASHRCGTNAKCTVTDGRPVCSCLNLHTGDPLGVCIKVECQIDEDCPSMRICTNNKCVDPCIGLCGINARCEVNQRVANCICLPGYTGNALTGCHVEDPQAACKPSPCGVNTQCNVIERIAVCKCLPGFYGRPLDGCRHECENDNECASHLSCSAKFQCENPCRKCGKGANCNVINHRPHCSCPTNWLGSPYTKCSPECIQNEECPRGKPACISHRCVNPCDDNPCGINANCKLLGIIPMCSCPTDMTGNPFDSCRFLEPRDLCEPNPCGINAKCTPGLDKQGNGRAVCTCPAGYFGNALVRCNRGECITNNECPNNRACIDSFCQNPCTGKECAENANCQAREHIAVCTCISGTRGAAAAGDIGCKTFGSDSRNNRRG